MKRVGLVYVVSVHEMCTKLLMTFACSVSQIRILHFRTKADVGLPYLSNFPDVPLLLFSLEESLKSVAGDPSAWSTYSVQPRYKAIDSERGRVPIPPRPLFFEGKIHIDEN